MIRLSLLILSTKGQLQEERGTAELFIIPAH